MTPLKACAVCGRPSPGARCADHTMRPRSRGTAWRQLRASILQRDGWQCTHREPSGRRCTATTKLHVDHITPRAAGGTDHPSNLTTLCEHHNLSKGYS